jgi:hypothetical protein
MSTPPPGAKGAMSRIGLVGQACAQAGNASEHNATTNAITLVISLLPHLIFGV